MKIATIIARLLLGFIFVVFGSNIFLHFIPMPPPAPTLVGDFSKTLFLSHGDLPSLALPRCLRRAAGVIEDISTGRPNYFSRWRAFAFEFDVRYWTPIFAAAWF
jgi:hypothetical protein